MELSPNGITNLTQGKDGHAVKRDAAIGSDFDTFLKMLTAQISNQDPLNPMNSEEFAVQLATFSGVEQQVRTNELLEMVAEKVGESGLGQMASWVGMKARATMPVRFSGDSVQIAVPDPLAGSRHELVALDSNGNEVWRTPHLAGTTQAEWDGIGADGRALPTGVYSFQLKSFDGDRLVSTAPAQTYGTVQEVRLDKAGPVIVFAGGIERMAEDVSALRSGQAVGAAAP